MLEFRNISFSFPGRRGAIDVLRDVSFTCGEDEIVAVIGPSGCGKSTLLSLATGLRTPTSGEVFIDGKAVRGADPRIGMLFQQNTLLPWRSVVENVELGLEIRGEPKGARRKRALDLMQQYGLAGFDRKYPHVLSGGMQKRAALAQTLAIEPSVLLLDEPFAALDAQTRIVIQNDVVKICRARKRTMLIVTHDIAEALAMAERVVVLSRRPAQVKEIYDVTFSREAASVADAPALSGFAEYYRRIWHALDQHHRGVAWFFRAASAAGYFRAGARLDIILAGAELGVARGHEPVFFSSPTEIVSALQAQMADGSFLPNVGITAFETLLGLVTGSLAGMAVGLVLPQMRLVANVFEPFLMVLNGIPVIVIAPLFILWLGLGLASKVGISVYIVFFTMFIPVYTASLRLDRTFVDALRVMGASSGQIFWTVIVPSSLPRVYTGLKIGSGLALIGGVICEFVASRARLGHLILYARDPDTPRFFSASSRSRFSQRR